MSESPENRGADFYALTYDVSVPDWPGEIDFYQELAAEATRRGGQVLELACGTGRVAIRLAQAGANVVRLDLSARMLAVARQKSAAVANIRWVQGDMRAFELGETFELALIPGHSFHNLNTGQDQASCLECIKRHLAPGGRLVLHLDYPDMAWFGDLVRETGGRFEPEEQFRHPQTGRQVRTSRAWWYEPTTQSAICQTRWEEVDDAGQVVDHWETEPHRLHSIFPLEVEHLLARVGLAVEAVYGDFFRNPLQDKSPGMVWVARNGEGPGQPSGLGTGADRSEGAKGAR